MKIKRAPVAIIDIGSNSIRMVIYEKLSRTLTPLYNEKSACSLGRGVAINGKLDEKNIAKALKTMRRFRLIMRLVEVKFAYCVATSAVRSAINGLEFARQVEKIIGIKVNIISGEEEALFAAFGAISGMPDFSGLIGDLGGGSLELSFVGKNSEKAKQQNYQTFPLGVITLMEKSKNSLFSAAEFAREKLKKSPIFNVKAELFCAIGGTWRAIALLHQKVNNYPLTMVQNYQIEGEKLLQFCAEIVKNYEGKTYYPGYEYVSSARADLVPFGAAIMQQILLAHNFKYVVFSALGLREGYLFSKLSKKEQKKHPLIEACHEISILRSRNYQHSLELIDFSEQFMLSLNKKEKEKEKILRKAACLLADIGWRSHPDYRSEESIELVSFGALVGISHIERAYLANILSIRYKGQNKESYSEILSLLPKEKIENSSILGLLFRLAFVISAGAGGILPKVYFSQNKNILFLHLPKSLIFLQGARLNNRLKNLAKIVGFSAARIIIE